MLVVNERLGEEGGEPGAESRERRAESGERRKLLVAGCSLLVGNREPKTVNLELKVARCWLLVENCEP
jgi:hypothetical protein